jgi:hypothetical protein
MKKDPGVVRSFVPALLALFSYSILLSQFVVPAAAQRLPVITSIEDSERIILPHTTHPLARPGFDLGSAETDLRMERMLLVLGPSDDVQQQLRALIDGQHDKQSPNYHQWITPEAFGERFGPAQADVDKITGWLQQKGFDSIKVSRGKSTIEFSGPVRLVQQAFGTEMHYYQLNGEKHLANNGDISIPRAMSGIVRGVTLENFSFAKPALTQVGAATRNSQGKMVPIEPQADFNGTSFLAPGDFAKIYDLNPLYSNNVNGAGASIAIVARSNILLSDVEAFRQAFLLPPNDPNIIVNGQDPGPTLGSDYVEASVDSQWTGAIAPNATINVVVSQSTSTTDGVILSMTYIVDNNLADIMSVSFSNCEQNIGLTNSLFNALYQQAAAQGISIIAASGDSGAAGCDLFTVGSPAQNGLGVNGLASTQFNTAVGGTEFNDANNEPRYWGLPGLGQVSVLGYVPEMVWNESCDPTQSANCPNNSFSLSGAGGGVSTLYTKPSWQSTGVKGVPNDDSRDVPDVSFTAASHEGYLFCLAELGPCETSGNGDRMQLLASSFVGGTSVSAQVFAGVVALVDQQQGGRQGLANYVLYKLAAHENFGHCNSSSRTDPTQPAPAGCIFNDTTVGNNGVPGNDTLSAPVPPGDTVGQLGYNATVGYDPASGLGSVNAANLLKAWNSVTFRGSVTKLTESSTKPIQHGQTISFRVSVAPLSGSGKPTGPVVLLAKNAPAPFNNTALGAGTLSNGVFTGAFNTLPGGNYQVVARYGGDDTFGGSESAPVNVNIAQEGGSVSFSGFDLNGTQVTAPGVVTIPYGFEQSFPVTIIPASGNGEPIGTVTLMDSGVPIAELPLNNQGQVTFFNCFSLTAQFCLSLGNHSLTAVYSGDSSFPTMTSPVLTVSITKSQFAFFLVVGVPVSNLVQFNVDFGSPTSTTATFPTGTVTFTDTVGSKTTSLGPPVTITAPQLIRNFALSAGRTHNLTVQYSGDNNYLPQKVSVPLTVPGSKLAHTKTTLQSLTSPIVAGQSAGFQVTVAAASGTPTGEAEVLVGDQILDFENAPHQLVNGSVIITGTVPDSFGIVQAFYLGDSNLQPSLSQSVAASTGKFNPSLSVVSNVSSVQQGNQVSLAATLAIPAFMIAPQGTVQFFDSLNGGKMTPLGQAPQQFLSSNFLGSQPQTFVATIPAVLSGGGTHTITAVYTGDMNYKGATSTTTVTVSGSAP